MTHGNKFEGNYQGYLNGIVQLVNVTQNPTNYNLFDQPTNLSITKNVNGGKNRYVINGAIDLTSQGIFVNNLVSLTGVGYQNENVLNVVLQGFAAVSQQPQLLVFFLIEMQIHGTKVSQHHHVKKIKAETSFLGANITSAGVIGTGVITARRIC